MARDKQVQKIGWSDVNTRVLQGRTFILTDARGAWRGTVKRVTIETLYGFARLNGVNVEYRRRWEEKYTSYFGTLPDIQIMYGCLTQSPEAIVWKAGPISIRFFPPRPARDHFKGSRTHTLDPTQLQSSGGQRLRRFV